MMRLFHLLFYIRSNDLHVNVHILQLNENVFVILIYYSDVVPALPEGWPAFRNRLWRRRSCELVKSTSSCVRKAVSHLHHLQNLLDSSCMRYQSSPTEKPSRNEFLQEKSSMTSDGTLSLSRTNTDSPLKDGSYQKETPVSCSGNHHRLRWLLSSASLGEFNQEQDDAMERRLESSASGAILEVDIQ